MPFLFIEYILDIKKKNNSLPILRCTRQQKLQSLRKILTLFSLRLFSLNILPAIVQKTKIYQSITYYFTLVTMIYQACYIWITKITEAFVSNAFNVSFTCYNSNCKQSCGYFWHQTPQKLKRLLAQHSPSHGFPYLMSQYEVTLQTQRIKLSPSYFKKSLDFVVWRNRIWLKQHFLFSQSNPGNAGIPKQSPPALCYACK